RRACSRPSGASMAAMSTAGSPSGIVGAGPSGCSGKWTSGGSSSGCPARGGGIEYDPTRSARIALLHYRDGEKRYIIAPLGLKPGDVVMSGPQADILPGNALPIRNIPLGTLVHNVELQPGKGG